MKSITVKDLIKELSEYPMDMEVYYVTRYALIPLELELFEDKYLGVDMLSCEKHKYIDK